MEPDANYARAQQAYAEFKKHWKEDLGYIFLALVASRGALDEETPMTVTSSLAHHLMLFRLMLDLGYYTREDVEKQVAALVPAGKDTAYFDEQLRRFCHLGD